MVSHQCCLPLERLALLSALNQSPERSNIVVLTEILLSHGNSSEKNTNRFGLKEV